MPITRNNSEYKTTTDNTDHTDKTYIRTQNPVLSVVIILKTTTDGTDHTDKIYIRNQKSPSCPWLILTLNIPSNKQNFEEIQPRRTQSYTEKTQLRETPFPPWFFSSLFFFDFFDLAVNLFFKPCRFKGNCDTERSKRWRLGPPHFPNLNGSRFPGYA
jgi:hypothetical protein